MGSWLIFAILSIGAMTIYRLFAPFSFSQATFLSGSFPKLKDVMNQ